MFFKKAKPEEKLIEKPVEYKPIEEARSPLPTLPKIKKEVYRVVKEIPMQPIRMLEDDDTIFYLITTEEALTIQMNGEKE